MPPRTKSTLAAAGAAAAILGVVLAARRPRPPVVDLTRHGFIRRDLATPAGRMAVFEAGVGPPLLFLHGIGGGASSYYWFCTAPAFVDRYRVVVPDLIGWGQSEHPAHPVLFDDYIAAIAALIADIGTTAVVAQSLSAGFAAALASRHHGSISQLAMLAPTGGRDFGVDQFPSLVAATLSRIARTPGVNASFYRAIFHQRSAIRSWYAKRGFLDAAAIPEAIVDAGHFSACQPNAEFSALPFVGGDLRFDIAPLLEALDVLATMLWGAEETIVRAEDRERLEHVNPQIAVVTIPAARSNFELERSAETNAVLSDFLAR